MTARGQDTGSRIWRTACADDATVKTLAEAFDLSRPIARALCARGLSSSAAVARYLDPRMETLADPFALPSMDKAVDRLSHAVRANEPILIYGDYDVDGVTSVALLIHVLSRLGAQCTPFLPNRIRDGYGLSDGALRRCFDQSRPGLIVTVDCGTTSTEVVQQAQALGIDTIVTDHHSPSGAVAPAHAVVNPKLGDDPRTHMLAGVGVAYKLAAALTQRMAEEGWGRAETICLEDYLDYVAMGTIADIVPLLEENRILAFHGLHALSATRSVGLRQLMDVAGVSQPVTSAHVGFVLGPRINAAGRIGDAGVALELLLTEVPERAQQLAVQLSKANQDRQTIERRIVEEAQERLRETFDEEHDYGLVVANRAWHAGVIGIVASRLCAIYQRPTIVIGLDEEGRGRGSCRSIEGFDLLSALERCGDALLKYGGHAMAAGLEIETGQIEAFRRRFNEVAAEALETRDLRPVALIDGWLRPEDIGDRLFAEQERLRPFGHMNPLPLWAMRDVRLRGFPRTVGGGKHWRFDVQLAAGQVMEAIAFNMGDRPLPEGPFDLAFQLQQNTFRDRTYWQMNVQDFRRAEGPEDDRPGAEG